MSGVVSAINRVGSVVQGVGSVVRGVGVLANDVSGLLGGGYGSAGGGVGGLGVWAAGMQAASWRGLPFAVRESQIQRGRRTATHQYPFRDDVWVEDLGRGMRTITFSGYLVGDDVFAQRDAMLAAAETAGPGALVHPSLGAVTATLTEFSCGERAETGRIIEIQFNFVQSGQDQPLFPAISVASQSVTGTAAAQCLASAGSDFANSVSSAIATGVDVVNAGVATVQGFVNTANTLVGDASRVAGAVRGLGAIVGGGANFGRFDGGGLAAVNNVLGPVNQALSLATRTTTAVNGLLSAAVTATTAVQRTGAAALSLAAAL